LPILLLHCPLPGFDSLIHPAELAALKSSLTVEQMQQELAALKRKVSSNALRIYRKVI
jgi:hypothetical protein